MSFCPSCGKNVGESAFCPDCGYPVNGKVPAAPQPAVQYVVKPVTPDAPDRGWFIIGLLCPLVGLVMYLLCHGSKPKRATSAGKGAIWGILFPFVCAVILLILGIFFYAFYSLFTSGF